MHSNINVFRNRCCRMFCCARMFITYTIDRNRKNKEWCGANVKFAQTTTNGIGFCRDGHNVAGRYRTVCPWFMNRIRVRRTSHVNEGSGKDLRLSEREKSFLRFRDPQPLCIGTFSHEIPRSNYMSSLCSWNLRLYC